MYGNNHNKVNNIGDRKPALGVSAVSSVTDEKKTARDSTDRVLAVMLFLADLFLLLACWQIIGVQADESLNIHGALRLLAGERIYRDFWVYNPPGIFFWTAGIMALFGKSLFVIRVALSLAASLATAVLYLLARKFMGRMFSLLPPLLFLAVGVNLWPVAGYHWYSTLLLLSSIFFVAKYVETPSRFVVLLAGGALAGTVFLFQQPKGGLLLVFLFSFLALEPLFRQGEVRRGKESFRATLLFCGGAGCALIAAAVFFFFNGTLKEAVDAIFVFPIRLLSESGGDQSGYAEFYGYMTRDLLANMVKRSAFLSNGGLSIRVVVFLLNYAAPLSIPAAVIVWGIRRARNAKESPVIILCAFAAAASFMASLQKPDFHHLLSASPPAYLTIAYVLHSLHAGRINEKIDRILQTSAAALALVLVAAALRITIANIAFSSRLTILPLRSALGFVPALAKSGNAPAAEQNPLINVLDFLEMRTRPREKIFVMSYSPFIYYLSGHPSSTRYIDIPSSPCGTGSSFHVLKLGEASFNRKRLVDVVEELEEARTRFVILDPAASCQITDPRWAAAAEADPLIGYISRYYRVEADFGDYLVMTRSD